MLQGFRFFSLLFATLAFVPGAAHVLELRSKLHLSAHDYLTVQQIYRGWALTGVVVLGALLSITGYYFSVQNDRRERRLALTALMCILATQVVFWSLTYPVNYQTSNWTVLPEHWTALRARWELSHALGACLDLAALIALFLAVLHTDVRRAFRGRRTSSTSSHASAATSRT